MPYVNADANLIRRPEFIGYADDRPTGGIATTLAADADIGDTTITLATPGSFASGVLRIGAGETLERVDVLSVSAGTATLAKPLLKAHVTDEPVVEQIIYELGDVDGDVTITPSEETSDVQSAMRLLTYAILRGTTTAAISARILGTSLFNIATAMGLPHARVTGTGLASDPRCLQTDLSDVDTAANRSLIVVSRKRNGGRVLHEFWSTATDYSGLEITLARGQAGAVPLSLMVLSGMVQQELAANEALPFTIDTSRRATNGLVFRELREVGLLERTGATGTLNDDGGNGAAGEKALTLSGAIAGVATGSLVAFGEDDRVEVHEVDSVASATLTMKTGLLRTISNGALVQRVAKVPMRTVVPGSTVLALGGSTAPIFSEYRRLPIAMQPNTVTAALRFATNDLLLDSVAQALGVPQSAIANNRALLTEEIGRRKFVGAYLEGVLDNGTVCRAVVWGTTAELQNVAIALGATTPAQLAYSLRPSSGLQLTQWTV